MTSPTPSAKGVSSLKIYLRLLGYVKPYVGYFALSLIGYVIFASSQPMLAGILKDFVDGLANPEAVMFPEVAFLREVRMLEVVPLLIGAIAAWQGIGSSMRNSRRKATSGNITASGL